MLYKKQKKVTYYEYTKEKYNTYPPLISRGRHKEVRLRGIFCGLLLYKKAKVLYNTGHGVSAKKTEPAE